MDWTVELTGLNLERCLTLAAQAGVVLRSARRFEGRALRVRVRNSQKKALEQLCERYGWEMRVVSCGVLLRAAALLRRRPMLPAAAALSVALTLISSGMIWRVDILNAGKDIGEVRTFLREQRIGPGAFKRAISLSALRDALILRLPDLAFAGVRFEGSTLVVDCQPALEGEQVLEGGSTLDLIALQDGIVTRIAVHSGTPQVEVGQAVRAGDVLIRGEERGEKGSTHPVQAQGEIRARVWSRGDARASLYTQRTVETGAIRRRVTLCSPWGRRVIRDAQPFDAQDTSVVLEPVVGLYLPVWREIETYAQIRVIRETRRESDAISTAQGAALQRAKQGCPPGAEPLDQSVYTHIGNDQYAYATVILEYEADIAIRNAQDFAQ